MYICSLITRQRDGRFSPNFKGSFRVSQGCFQAEKLGVVGRGQKIGIFSFLARPAGHTPLQSDWH